MSIAQEFAQAQKDVNELPTRPANNTLLKLYAYYKLATDGDASGERPGGLILSDARNSTRGQRSRASRSRKR